MSDTNEVKLTGADEFANTVGAMAWPITAVAVGQWTITSWLAQYKHAKRHHRPFRLQWPHTLSVMVYSGTRPGNVIETLRDYGVSCQETSSCIVVENGTKGFAMNLIVARSQWEMADALLWQYSQDGGFSVTSAPGSKRGANFGQPWGIGSKARSFQESIDGAIGNMFKGERKSARPAKLGKTYDARHESGRERAGK